MKLAVNRSWIILGMALGLGGLAAFGVNQYINRQVEDLEARGKSTKTVRVVVPKQDLPKGASLQAAMVAVREVPAEWSHSNALTPEQFDRVENQKLAYPAVRGEMILWSMLETPRPPSFSSRLAVGRRALTVPVDEVNSISGMLEPGDRIDLVATIKKDSRSLMFPLLQNVVILATGTRAVAEPDAKDGKRTYTTITLDASPDDAERVLAAREVGKLAALLRAPGDSVKSSNERKDAMSLLGFAETRSATSEVPVMYGGAGGGSKAAPNLSAAVQRAGERPDAGPAK